MNYEDIVIKAGEDFNLRRAILRLVQSEKFILWLHNLPQEEKDKFCLPKTEIEYDVLRKRVSAALPPKTLDDMGIVQLRQIASTYKIPYYSTLARSELVTAIKLTQRVLAVAKES